MTRPLFEKIKSYEEFSKYYWYREELQCICRQYGINACGMKAELNHNIEEYFNGNVICSKKKQRVKVLVKPTASRTNNEHSSADDIHLTLDTPLLSCNFRFSQRFRDFFSKQTGIERFKFNTDMVATARKVRETGDEKFTLGDLLDIFYGKKLTLITINHAFSGISSYRIFAQIQLPRALQTNLKSPQLYGAKSANQHFLRFMIGDYLKNMKICSIKSKSTHRLQEFRFDFVQ